MNLETLLGLAQVVIALLTIIAAPYLSKLILDRISGITIVCRPMIDSLGPSKGWIVFINSEKKIGHLSPVVCYPRNPHNSLISAKQTGFSFTPKRVNLNSLNFAEIDMSFMSPRSELKFNIFISRPDFLQFHIGKQAIFNKNFVFNSLNPLHNSSLAALHIAKWRILTVSIGFAAYAAMAAFRIIYLGFVYE